MKEHQYLTVNALTKYIKRKFDADPHLQNITVKGEISNFKQHSSGHMYFTLKDEKARILAVMFAGNAKSMKFRPENGMKVLVRGEVSVYEPSGQYQIYIKEMQPDGIGELYLAYEQLKEKLEKEGLFSRSDKRPIPRYPKTVAVITSPTGAAVRDVLTTIKRRYPIVNILIYPALVQGSQAAASIVSSIKMANSMMEADVLIIGRGGGSIEELWAFNEEQVARAIFHSEIPIISAVGHETDFTIADFVADLRAPTPTGAAELAVPHIDDLTERLFNRQSRLIRAMKEQVVFQYQRLLRLKKSYAFRYPQKLYEQKLEQLDKMTEQLVRGSKRLHDLKSEHAETLQIRLARSHPRQLIDQSKDKHDRLKRRLDKSIGNIVTDKEKDFARVLSTLEALSPLKIMDRGYSLAYTEKKTLIKTVAQIHIDDHIKVKVSDGTINCRVTEIEE
ncbi:exodeoxyribonuclease VII large subunit [Cytobacillus sp. NCCP-133]|uniref:exodeoxyribonuclease VII large subunit n=1 Tax=Cytobacillus sp. NCCP-133 TaxID=766848 RepID=UPI00223014EE|nr:exodeoxyribonuclease VII large subunit [Cytobacillus sp. NCCP-133]GLB58140.1 exodeoxyribonuclease 7 large subunit [Cytobacillus sp. NCCP-133]